MPPSRRASSLPPRPSARHPPTTPLEVWHVSELVQLMVATEPAHPASAAKTVEAAGATHQVAKLLLHTLLPPIGDGRYVYVRVTGREEREGKGRGARAGGACKSASSPPPTFANISASLSPPAAPIICVRACTHDLECGQPRRAFCGAQQL